MGHLVFWIAVSAFGLLVSGSSTPAGRRGDLGEDRDHMQPAVEVERLGFARGVPGRIPRFGK